MIYVTHLGISVVGVTEQHQPSHQKSHIPKTQFNTVTNINKIANVTRIKGPQDSVNEQINTVHRNNQMVEHIETCRKVKDKETLDKLFTEQHTQKINRGRRTNNNTRPYPNYMYSPNYLRQW